MAVFTAAAVRRSVGLVPENGGGSGGRPSSIHIHKEKMSTLSTIATAVAAAAGCEVPRQGTDGHANKVTACEVKSKCVVC